jgi:hypothetical protein
VSVGGPGFRAGLAARAGSTPGRLAILMAALIIAGLATGVAGVVGAIQRADAVDAVRARSGPLAVRAQDLYRSLSDADATAAAAFLSNGVEPTALRDRYQSDIAAASAALAAAGSGSTTAQDAVAQITAALPVYTGLVETARTYNRQQLPLGAAYLREASGLMRQRLLPAANQLYQAETKQLAADRGSAAGFPWVALPLALITLAGLVLAQRLLSRRTNRLFNVGLLGSTAVTVALVLWLGLSWFAAQSHLHSSDRDGSAQVEVLAQARIAALQARADEALTLVARGNGGAFETDYQAQIKTLGGTDGKGGLLLQARGQAADPAVRAAVDSASSDNQRWRAVHVKLRAADDGGDYPGAVALAIGGDQGSAASIFTQLDQNLAQAIARSNTTFGQQAGAAGGALSGLDIGVAILTVLLLAGVIVGFQQRIAEYR